MSVKPKSNVKAEVLKLIEDSLDQGLVDFAPGITEGITTVQPSTQAYTPELDIRDVIEGDDVLATVDVYYDLLDGVLTSTNDNYEYFTSAQATEIGLTPTQLESLNCGIDYINTTVNSIGQTGLPLGATRQDVTLFLSISVVCAPATTILASPIWVILKLLWKLAKWLFGARKHIKKIKQAKKLYKAGRITAGTAAKVIGPRLAALAALIASMAAEIKEAKELVDELRKEGKDEEADSLEERVKEMEERLKELQGEYDELNQGEGSGNSSSSGSGNTGSGGSGQ